MRKAVCKNCGMEMRIAGLAAICLRCGNLVTGTQEDTTEVIGPVAAAEVEAPPPRVLPMAEPAPSKKPIYILAGIFGGVVLLLITVIVLLLVRLSRPAPPVVAIPVPVPVTPSRPAPPPQRNDPGWFSEAPTPPPRPAPTPPAPQPTPTTPPPQVAPVQPPASQPVVKPPKPHAQLASLRARPPTQSVELTDEKIVQSINRAMTYLNSQFVRTRLRGADGINPHTFAGMNALAAYALLQGGKSLGDSRLGPTSNFVNELLDRLKEFPMDGHQATYSRSLRISAMAVYNRPKDRSTIEADFQWLLRSSMRGAYSYDLPPQGRTRDQNVWDNSNSQYGALGVWAASEVGLRAPASFWTDVEQHWTSTQVTSGGWGYTYNAQVASLSMTAAGTNMLFVARDQLAPIPTSTAPFTPLSKPIQRALEWLDEGDNVMTLSNNRRGYTIYSLERAGLASGYKFFGKYDWYKEWTKRLIVEQSQDGSWNGDDGPVVETSFNLLFMLRGREPIVMAKLRFDGDWSNRPRDVPSLVRFASYQLERQLSWQMAAIDRDWWEWSDASVLLITSHRAGNLADHEVDKLRAYCLAGGMIFLNAERDSEEFNQFAADLANRLFPNRPLETLPPSHPIYSAMFPVDPKPALRGISNGVRLLLLHSPTDLTRQWQPAPQRNQRLSSDMGTNIIVYTNGKRNLRQRLDSMFVPEPAQPASGKVPIARLKYEGDWNPEPAAWTRASRILQERTGIAIDIIPTEITSLKYETAPIAHLTGLAAFNLIDADVDALRVFLTRGGTLLIDCIGTSTAFGDFIQDKLIRRLSTGAVLQPLRTEHALLAGGSSGMKELRQPLLRVGTPNTIPPMQQVKLGEGTILFSRLDLTSGLLGVNTAGLTGYDPAWSQDFLGNLVLWTIRQFAPEP